MNRRKAISGILWITGGCILSYSGVRVYNIFKDPDLKSLEKHRILIDELSETIIPASEYPGAKEAHVGDFVIKMLYDCTNLQSQNNFIEGLNSLANYAKQHFHRSFEECSVEEKFKILNHYRGLGKPYSGLLGKAQHRLLGASFFETLKKYTVLGYCTSMLGATQALSYDFVPGKYVGIVPLKAGQRAWATQ